MTKEKEVILEEITKRMPNPVQTLGYMEHQMDLVTQLTVDLLYLLTEVTALVDPADLPQGMVERLSLAEELLVHSSVDFDNLNHPMQSYKFPSANKRKEETRQIQQRYLSVLQQRGLE